jgi:hypothetical protein
MKLQKTLQTQMTPYLINLLSLLIDMATKELIQVSELQKASLEMHLERFLREI